MRKRYLFFDIDGTLLAGEIGKAYIPESTREALQLLRADGHFLAIATGRLQSMAVGVMHELGFENMVSDGGYGITIENRLLGIRPLDRDDVVALVRECDALGFPWGILTENSSTRFVPDDRFPDFHDDSFIRSVLVPGLDPAEQDQIFKVHVACRPGDEYRLTTLAKLPWCRYHDDFFFVEPVDKSFGIRQILDHFHADHRDAIVFGDAMNDLSMFSDEWTNVAMGNAVPELKQKADLVTTDVDKDGIYNACVSLGLIPARESPHR